MSVELQAGSKSESKSAVHPWAGVFAGRVYIETVTLADDDPWVVYYAAHPELFPEIVQPKDDEVGAELLE